MSLDALDANERRIFKLSREETIDVTYEVEAASLDDAVRKLRDYDDGAIVARWVDDHCSNGPIQYFGTDTVWHPIGSDVPAAVEVSP